MIAGHDHGGSVDAWMRRAAKAGNPELLIQAFEQCFAALWGRAHHTLGDVTLTAIVDRVLYTAAERYSFLSGVEVDPSGLRTNGLRESARSANPAQLAEGIRFVLVEFLTVLGNLTAEILAPALQAELSRVAVDGGGPDPKTSQGEASTPARKGGEEVKG
jgi:hypothetical protein